LSILPDRIALIGTTIPGGGSVFCKHLRRFLESIDITVDFYDGSLYTLREVRKQRADPTLANVPVLKRVVREIARELNEKVYPIVVVTEREDILLEKLPPETRRFHYVSASLAYERYYRWIYNGDPEAERKLIKALEFERCIYQAADVVTFVWVGMENFVREKVHDGDNFISDNGLGWYGCDPRLNRARYQEMGNIVFLGHIDYWSNPSLLQNLSTMCPDLIDCYGKIHVPISGIEHKGIARDEYEIFSSYQFGLNSVSTDAHRKAAHSSKILTYISAGLPVFSPDWQTYSHLVDGVIPYNEENFMELVQINRQKSQWEQLSEAAFAQAQELRWEKVLQGYFELLKNA
jgi:hypothetical protein